MSIWVPLQWNLIPVIVERNKDLRQQCSLLWNFTFSEEKDLEFEFSERLPFQVCTDQICSCERKQGAKLGKHSLCCKDKQRRKKIYVKKETGQTMAFLKLQQGEGYDSKPKTDIISKKLKLIIFESCHTLRAPLQ